MKQLPLLAWAALPLVALANQAPAPSPDASGCALDTTAYRQRAQALAQSKPGSTWDPSSYTVTWSDPELGRVSLAVGGCAHLGLQVSSSRRLARASGQADAISFAQQLVRQLWPEPHATRVAYALTRLKIEHQSSERTMWVGHDDPHYDSIVLTHKRAHGETTISVEADLTP